MVSRAAAERFLERGPLAFVGVSRDPRQFSATVYRQLRAAGTDLVPVNPGAEAIEGDRCYPDVASLPDGVAGAIVMVPAGSSAAVVRACAERGIERVWLFKGAGPSSVSAEALEAAAAAGMEVIDGACPLMFTPTVGGIHRIHRTARRLRGALTA